MGLGRRGGYIYSIIYGKCIRNISKYNQIHSGYNFVKHLLSLTETLTYKKWGFAFENKSARGSERLSGAKLLGAEPQYMAGPQYAVGPQHGVGRQVGRGRRYAVGPQVRSGAA